jgi:hypothetical protein
LRLQRGGDAAWGVDAVVDAVASCAVLLVPSSTRRPRRSTERGGGAASEAAGDEGGAAEAVRWSVLPSSRAYLRRAGGGRWGASEGGDG